MSGELRQEDLQRQQKTAGKEENRLSTRPANDDRKNITRNFLFTIEMLAGMQVVKVLLVTGLCV